jgi:hypothetical protein
MLFLIASPFLLLTPRLVFAGAGRQRGRVKTRKQDVFLRLVSLCIYHTVRGLGHSDILYVTRQDGSSSPSHLYSLHPIDEAGFQRKKKQESKEESLAYVDRRMYHVARVHTTWDIPVTSIESSYSTSLNFPSRATAEPRKMTRSSPSPRRFYAVSTKSQSLSHSNLTHTPLPYKRSKSESKKEIFLFSGSKIEKPTNETQNNLF